MISRLNNSDVYLHMAVLTTRNETWPLQWICNYRFLTNHEPILQIRFLVKVYRRVGVVVRAFASQSEDLGSALVWVKNLVESDQKT